MVQLRFPSTSLSAIRFGKKLPNLSSRLLKTPANFSVRLAKTRKELRAVQALRYQVFFEEMSARSHWRQKFLKRDTDHYDGVCDHLMLTVSGPTNRVTKKARLPNGETVIGCYRLMHHEAAIRHKGFYSAGEFDLGPMLEQAGLGLRFLELGRSCVAPDYRTKHGIDLLWSGLGKIVNDYGVDALIGCASFPTTDIAQLAEPLSFLHHNFTTKGPWHVRALESRYVDMNMMAADKIDKKRAMRQLPPVLRGYIRMGCMIGDGAVIDHAFGTTDVFVLMPLTLADDRYLSKFANRKTGEAINERHDSGKVW